MYIFNILLNYFFYSIYIINKFIQIFIFIIIILIFNIYLCCYIKNIIIYKYKCLIGGLNLIYIKA